MFTISIGKVEKICRVIENIDGKKEFIMNIRKATVSDAKALLEIYRPYVEKTAISFEYDVPTVEEFEERIRTTLINYPYIVLEDEGEIRGYAYVSIFHGREAYSHAVETSIYVDKDCKGKGYGKALYEAMDDILLKQNVFVEYACIAISDREDDEYLINGSVKFHEKVGYNLVGTHRNCGYKFNKWYGVVWMEKRLCELPDNPEKFIPYSKL